MIKKILCYFGYHRFDDGYQGFKEIQNCQKKYTCSICNKVEIREHHFWGDWTYGFYVEARCHCRTCKIFAERIRETW